MSQMPPPPPPPPPPSGTDTSTDRQTGTVKPSSSSRAMEAWTLWDKLKYAARKAWLAFLAALH